MKGRRVSITIVCAGVAASFMATLLSSGAVAEESVAVLRSGVTVPITEVSKAGVLATGKGTGARRVSLSAVRRVDGPLAAEFRTHEVLAQTMWRAGARLDRGDAPGAEPLYELAWTMTTGEKGPTRAEAAAGLLSCRVQRGAYALAVEAWAAWLAEAGSLESSDAERCRARLAVGDGLDSSSQWLTGLPPVFVDGPFVRAFAAVESEGADTGGVPDVMSIYRFAAKRDSGSKRGDASAFENAKGWNNVAGEMVLAESGDPAVRERARKRLRDRAASDAPAWQAHWARLGLGRSLRLETDASSKTDAVIELLWIASRESVASNVLAHALLAAAETLVELDEGAAAARVVADLEARLPDHPIITSARLSQLRATAGLNGARSTATLPGVGAGSGAASTTSGEASGGSGEKEGTK
jgi:hypothetical protein